jgi:hypothetical protein
MHVKRKNSGAFMPLFNYLENHRLMENTNFAINRWSTSFLSIAILQYIFDRQTIVDLDFRSSQNPVTSLRISVIFVRFNRNGNI